MVGGHVHRSSDGLHASGLRPVARGLKEHRGYLLVLEALEVAEEAHALLVKLIVQVVDDGGDGAHHPPVPPRQEELHVGVLEKGIVPGTEELHPLPEEGRHPARVIPVEPPRKGDKLLELRLTTNELYCSLGHATSPLDRLRRKRRRTKKRKGHPQAPSRY